MKLTTEQVKEQQRMLAAAGCDPGPIDGIWAARTDAANKACEAIFAAANGLPSLDARSERHLATLLPRAQHAARKFLATVRQSGIDARIISGHRTWAEQDALYEIGRTKPGNRVTNARGGYSNHNFGIAWDIGIFDQGNYLDESPLYDHAGDIGRGLGMEWGGDWKTFQDKPHFGLKTPYTIAQLRQRYLAGQDFFTRWRKDTKRNGCWFPQPA